MLERIRAGGPLAASDFEEGKGKGGWWEWGDTKRALEWLFWAGLITTATRRASFERVYDLTERVIPAADPGAADAGRGRGAAGAGRAGRARRSASPPRPTCATISGSSPEAARRAVAELVEEGVLLPAAVEGWAQARLSPPRRAPAAPDPRPGPARAVRSAGLGARPDRAAVRLPLPDRDLHAGREAGARLLRPALPARRAAGRARRPQGRPQGVAAAGAGRRRSSPARRPKPPSGWTSELDLMARWLGLEAVKNGAPR